MTEIPASSATRAIYDELLDAAWTRVHAGPVEHERRRVHGSVWWLVVGRGALRWPQARQTSSS